ncbi:MAG: AhpC/TSA family protein [Bacteroidales bacterium]|nr:AhpC/TSA family protein [Bacteroidales bacterium]
MARVLILLFFIFSLHVLQGQEYRSAAEAQGIPSGVKAPLFEAYDNNNKVFSLKKAFSDNPVVLIFYRGHWCPVCNAHLSNLQDSLRLIENTGATVVAISPEKPEFSEVTAEKTGANFRLLYDEDYKIADAYDVTFRPDGTQRIMYNVFLGADLKEAHSDESQRLPVPATFVIDTDGTIKWRHFDPDYKNRASVKNILDALKKPDSVHTHDKLSSNCK